MRNVYLVLCAALVVKLAKEAIDTVNPSLAYSLLGSAGLMLLSGIDLVFSAAFLVFVIHVYRACADGSRASGYMRVACIVLCTCVSLGVAQLLFSVVSPASYREWLSHSVRVPVLRVLSVAYYGSLLAFAGIFCLRYAPSSFTAAFSSWRAPAHATISRKEAEYALAACLVLCTVALIRLGAPALQIPLSPMFYVIVEIAFNAALLVLTTAMFDACSRNADRR